MPPAAPQTQQPQDVQALGRAWDANPIGNPPDGYNSPYANALRAQNGITAATSVGGTANPNLAGLQQQVLDYQKTLPNYTAQPLPDFGRDSPTSKQFQLQAPPEAQPGIAQAIANSTNIANAMPQPAPVMQPPAGQSGGGSPATPVATPASVPTTPATGASNGFAGSDALLQQMQSQMGKIQNPYDLLQGRENALGIPGQQQQVSALRQAITNTTNLLNQVSPSVQGRVSNSLVNAAQANRMIQNESAPIQGQISTLGTQAQDAQSTLQNLMSQATTEAGMQSQGQQDVLKNLGTLQGLTMGSEQAKASQAQFAAQQAQAKEEFEKNLALDVQKFGLSKQQADESRRQFDVTTAKQTDQFQQQQALAQQQYQQSISQFAQTRDLEIQKYQQQQALETQKYQQGIDQFRQTQALEQQKMQQAQDQANAALHEQINNTQWQHGLDVFNQGIAQQTLTDKSQLQDAQAQMDIAKASRDAALASGGGKAQTAASALSDSFASALDMIAKGPGGIGADGYANPSSYNAARDAWAQQGGKTTLFDQQFAYLKNPTTTQYKSNK